MSPNLARLTSVESTTGRAGARSGKGARMGEWLMAVTRKLNRGVRSLVTRAVASDVNTGGCDSVTVEGMSVSTRMRSPATFLPEPLPPQGLFPLLYSPRAQLSSLSLAPVRRRRRVDSHRDVRVGPGKAADDVPRRAEHASGRRARSQ